MPCLGSFAHPDSIQVVVLLGRMSRQASRIKDVDFTTLAAKSFACGVPRCHPSQHHELRYHISSLPYTQRIGWLMVTIRNIHLGDCSLLHHQLITD